MNENLRTLVANVGERDLYYNVGSESEPDFCHFEWGKSGEPKLTEKLRCQPGARYIAKAVLKYLEVDPSEAKRFRYPILNTVLEVVTRDSPLVQLILIVTDQPESTRLEYRSRDSLYTGEILKRLIYNDYKDRVKEITLKPYQRPPIREEAYAFFGTLLPQVAPVEKTEKLYASLSGGVPALNDSLQEQAIRLYRDKCALFEISPPAEEECRQGARKGKLKPVSLKPFLRDLVISLVEQLINRYDYSGAFEVLRTFNGVRFWSQEVGAVLKHAERRLNLNFKEAADAIERFKDRSPYQNWYQTMKEPYGLDRLVETYFVADIRYQNREYADMLWRIRSIFEIGMKLPPRRAQQGQVWGETSQLLYSLWPLCNLTNTMLHRLEGISIGKINNEFKPASIIAQIYQGKSTHELIIPTLKEIATRLSQLLKKEALLHNPYQEINEHVMKMLRG